jgi:methyl-accepting chemotaxis protein
MMGYLVGILVLTILFSISIRHLSTVVSDYDILVKDAWRQLDSLQNIRAAGMQIKMDVENNPSNVDRSLAQVDNSFTDFLNLARGGIPLDLVLLVRDYHLFRQQVLRAPSVEAESFSKAYNVFMGKIYVEIEKSRGSLRLSESRFIERIDQILLLNVVLAPLSFLFLYYYGFMISNYTGLRLKKFLQGLQDVLSGKYEAKIEDDALDEIGQIAAGINELAGKVK